MNLNRKIKKCLNKIIKSNNINQNEYCLIDFIYFYLWFNFYYYKWNLNQINDYFNEMINRDWKSIINIVKNNQFESLSNIADVTLIYQYYYDSLIAYYNVNDVHYFFESEYNVNDYYNQQQKYDEYLLKHQWFFDLFKIVLNKDFGTVYNYVKKFKKGV